MDRGAWWTIVHGVTRLRHDLMTISSEYNGTWGFRVKDTTEYFLITFTGGEYASFNITFHISTCFIIKTLLLTMYYQNPFWE